MERRKKPTCGVFFPLNLWHPPPSFFLGGGGGLDSKIPGKRDNAQIIDCPPKQSFTIILVETFWWQVPQLLECLWLEELFELSNSSEAPIHWRLRVTYFHSRGDPVKSDGWEYFALVWSDTLETCTYNMRRVSASYTACSGPEFQSQSFAKHHHINLWYLSTTLQALLPTYTFARIRKYLPTCIHLHSFYMLVRGLATMVEYKAFKIVNVLYITVFTQACYWSLL